MCDTLKMQFSLAEENFLTSLSCGSEAVDTFYRSWTTLQANFDEVMLDGSLDEETASLAHRVASRIQIIAGGFLELYEEADASRLALQNDLAIVFADLNIGTETSTANPDSVKSDIAENSVTWPSYIRPAYTWLLKNLHNPYPSKEFKGVIASKTKTSLRDIDSWFTNVRKRIGWNKLRMKHYKNKRSRIVDAATRFFKEVPQALHHGSYPTHLSDIDPTPNHDSEFKEIETRAKELYSGKLSEIPLATKLDGEARNSIPEIKACAQGKEELRRQVTKRKSTYPSPAPSPERSLSPPPNTLLPVSDAYRTTNRKRRNSDSSEPDIGCCTEPQKRRRMDCYQFSHDLAIASLPSPAASLPDIPQDSSATPSDQCIIIPTPIPAASSGKRKRRLSDAGSNGPPKRPHNALAVPRLQTVSDPLPLPNPIISELYKAINDSLPDPVSVEPLDDTQVEVDFYNYSTSSDAIQSFLLANSSLGLCGTTPSLSSSAFLEPPSVDESRATDDFLFEKFLKDLSTPQASTDISFFPDIPSHDDSTLFPSYENTVPIEPQEVFSDPLSYFQISSLPWNFQENDDIFSAIAPSTGTLFSSNHVPPQTDPTRDEKEAKRKQIEALRAQLQNLEAEL